MKTMLPRSPNDPEYPRWASDLKWMKGRQKRGRIDREIESRRRRFGREDGGDTGRTVNTRIKKRNR